MYTYQPIDKTHIIYTFNVLVVINSLSLDRAKFYFKHSSLAYICSGLSCYQAQLSFLRLFLVKGITFKGISSIQHSLYHGINPFLVVRKWDRSRVSTS